MRFSSRVLFLLNGNLFVPKTFLNYFEKYKKSCFINLIGLPRSGTSILLEKLNESNGIFMLYEPMNTAFRIFRNKMIDFIPYYEFEKNREHLLGIKPGNYSFFGEKSIFGSAKLMNLSIHLKILLNNNDKFILLTRDSRSRYLSYKKWIEKRNVQFKYIASENPKSIDYEVARWIKFYKFCKRFSNRKNVLIVDYDDMIRNPNIIFGIIGDFLNIDLSAISCDDFFNSSLDKWKSELSREEIDYIDSKTRKYNSL